MRSSEMRQLEAEADAYQAIADEQRAAAPFLRIASLEAMLREVLAQWDKTIEQTPEDQRLYNEALRLLDDHQ